MERDFFGGTRRPCYPGGRVLGLCKPTRIGSVYRSKPMQQPRSTMAGQTGPSLTAGYIRVPKPLKP